MKTKLRRAGNRLLLSLAAVIASLLLIEAGLNVAAFFVRPRTPAAGGAGSGIACYGDSYTYGLGAEPSASYPAQLEALLRADGLDTAVSNYGYPGSNSRRAAQAFTGAKDAPRVAVVMTGYNNFWNTAGIEDEINPLPFARTRIGRLVSIVAANIGGKGTRDRRASCANPSKAPSQQQWEDFLARSQALIRAGRQDEARAHILAMLESWPGCQLIEKYMCTFEREAGNYDTALAWAKQALGHCACPAEEPHIHMELVYLYRITGRRAEALEEMRGASADLEYVNSVFPELCNVCKEGNLDYAAESAKMRAYIGKLHGRRGTRFWDMLAYADTHKSALSGLMVRDLETIRRRAAQTGTKLVLLTYPFEAEINPAIRAYARSRGLALVDTWKLFENRPHGAYFAADGHCNARGYGVIAGAVRTVIKENGWLDTTHTKR